VETEVILIFFSFLAGFFDAAVGGGGLILLPTLLIMFPTTSFVLLSGTNKFAAICGTSVSLIKFGRNIQLNKNIIFFCVPFAILFSYIGAKFVSAIPESYVKPIIIFFLVLVGLYVYLNPNLGKENKSKQSENSKKSLISTIITGSIIGFYDGFIGPGTGSILIFLLIFLLKYDFLNASANAKIVNVATNIGAIIYFISNSYVMWRVALIMAAANIVGGYTGTSFALKYGNVFLRKLFLVIVFLLLATNVYRLLSAL
jgi:uncharacterized membrane protein YfcA